ncbi:MAG TPA: hypothetical protein VK629_03325 [Steroidobacteraceae bacterium]|nr:hypothetical protein [Steroidobacteraceae bacterium]
MSLIWKRAAVLGGLMLSVMACGRDSPADPVSVSTQTSATQMDGQAMIGNTSVQRAAPAQIEFNGRALAPAELATLQSLTAQYGPVPPGRYWYDAATGAAGGIGGPTVAFLPAGLSLGGPLDPRASGGGDGRLTGVFINGRELHPLDVQRLQTIGAVVPGRYRWDAAGNVSTEAGMLLFNFNAVVQARGSNPYYRSDVSRGENTFVGKGCAAVSGRLSPSDSSSSYDYYVGCE